MLALPNSFWHVVGLVAAGVALRQTVSQPSDAQVRSAQVSKRLHPPDRALALVT